jgi:outer membrane protein assembly factor BamC
VLASAGSASLEVDDGFDRAWRRVGLALDRRGFTVEDRDRSAGLYFVRYVDPKSIEQQSDPGFFAKLFGAGKDAPIPTQRYRVSLKAAGEKTLVSVLDSQGAPEAGAAARTIVAGLTEELK